MSNEEQHEMLVGILTKLVPILDCDELSLLAHHCGVQIHEFYEPKPEPKKVWYFTEIREAA